MLGQLLDRVAAVAQDAGVAVEVGDGALHAAVDRYAGSYMRRSGSSSRSAELGNAPSVDGHRDLLARPVVDDRDGVGHSRSYLPMARARPQDTTSDCLRASTASGFDRSQRLQRRVVVLAGGQRLTLGRQHVEAPATTVGSRPGR